MLWCPYDACLQQPSACLLPDRNRLSQPGRRFDRGELLDWDRAPHLLRLLPRRDHPDSGPGRSLVSAAPRRRGCLVGGARRGRGGGGVGRGGGRVGAGGGAGGGGGGGGGGRGGGRGGG